MRRSERLFLFVASMLVGLTLVAAATSGSGGAWTFTSQGGFPFPDAGASTPPEAIRLPEERFRAYIPSASSGFVHPSVYDSSDGLTFSLVSGAAQTPAG